MSETPNVTAPAKDVHRRRRKTEICITIDTEFSIGGAFANPDRYRPISVEMVEGQVKGRGEGLDFLLHSFREHGVKATFFVEALQTFYYGTSRMGAIVERVVSEGHDVQLHLHPCWLHFRDREWRELAEANDSCAGRDPREFETIIQYAVDIFAQWGLPRPTALRAGGFQCDRNVYRAMNQCGIPLGSNIALGIYCPHDPTLHLVNGRHLIEGVLELPVLGYSMALPLMRPRVRNVAITSTSWRESEALLWAARDSDVSPVVVLTHPTEFVKRTDFRYEVIRRNGFNQRRLIRLLNFVARNSEEFAITTIAAGAERWLAEGPEPSKLLSVPRALSLMRAAENFINDRL